MKFEQKSMFFSPLLDKSDYNLSDQNQSLLNELNDDIARKTISFYPSAARDVDDIFYVNNRRIRELKELDPDVFIHSDVLNFFVDDYISDGLRENLIYMAERVDFLDERKSITIAKLKYSSKADGDGFKWFIYFGGYHNEDILRLFISKKIKIPLVYSVCDGITSGMGGIDGSIPTILYPLLAPELGFKYIITEQGIESARARILNDDELRKGEVRTWLNNIISVSNDHSFTELAILSDKDLREEIGRRLSAIDERPLNKNGKLECFNSVVDWMVIKKLT